MTKHCPKCGKSFECTHDKNCWCMTIKLSETTINQLKKEYPDCLCKECLEEFEANSSKNLAK